MSLGGCGCGAASRAYWRPREKAARSRRGVSEACCCTPAVLAVAAVLPVSQEQQEHDHTNGGPCRDRVHVVIVSMCVDRLQLLLVQLPCWPCTTCTTARLAPSGVFEPVRPEPHHHAGSFLRGRHRHARRRQGEPHSKCAALWSIGNASGLSVDYRYVVAYVRCTRHDAAFVGYLAGADAGHHQV